jgi:hypothetical protein
MEKTEVWALLWSKSGNGFHVEPLEQTAKSGMRFLKANQKNDYLLIAYGTSDEVFARAEELRPICRERGQ